MLHDEFFDAYWVFKKRMRHERITKLGVAAASFYPKLRQLLSGHLHGLLDTSSRPAPELRNSVDAFSSRCPLDPEYTFPTLKLDGGSELFQQPAMLVSGTGRDV